MRILKIVCMLSLLCLMAGLAAAEAPVGTDMPAYKPKSAASSLDDCHADFVVVTTNLPYSNSANLEGAGNDCARRRSEDHIYQIDVRSPGYYTFSTCATTAPTDTRIYLLTECCAGTVVVEDNNGCGAGSVKSVITCEYLSIGIYYLLIEAQTPETEGAYTLNITACSAPCGYPYDVADGNLNVGEGVYIYVQTTDSADSGPLYNGPWEGNGCNPDYSTYGFNYYSWGNQDYGWSHVFPYEELQGNDSLCIDFARLYICAYDIDFNDCVPSHNGDSTQCEVDVVHGDEFQLGNLHGTSSHYFNNQFAVPPSALYDGVFNVFLDIDIQNPNDCIYAATLSWSQLVVSYHICNRAPYTPEGTVPNCVDAQSDVCALLSGPFPSDPDGDAVNYEFEWFVYNSDDNSYVPMIWFSDCLPSSMTEVGDIYRLKVIARDQNDLVSDTLTLDFAPIVESCTDWPGDEYDMGDLDVCYPTLYNNPGHRLTNIAWLGQCVTGELTPHDVEDDGCDDGIQYHNLPWTPCQYEEVSFWITGGENYPAYMRGGGKLYLNGWKDGNIDGDFCDDYLCGEQASEWIVQDLIVTPSNGPGSGGNGDGWFTVEVLDPGVMEGQGSYDGVFRWRLTSRPIGRYGFGGPISSQDQCESECGDFTEDFLGEVEDYVLPDGQLPVELSSFTANPGNEEITLRWSTASETNNDHFEIMRDGSLAGRVEGAGNSVSTQHYSFSDTRLENGRTYRYTLVCVDINGSRQTMSTASASPSFNNAQVTEYALFQNYPNPFNPSTEIIYDLKEAGLVKLAVYDVLGREIKSLVNDQQSVGRHTILFEAKDLASGVYFYRLETTGFTDMKKMMLMK